MRAFLVTLLSLSVATWGDGQVSEAVTPTSWGTLKARYDAVELVERPEPQIALEFWHEEAGVARMKLLEDGILHVVVDDSHGDVVGNFVVDFEAGAVSGEFHGRSFRLQPSATYGETMTPFERRVWNWACGTLAAAFGLKCAAGTALLGGTICAAIGLAAYDLCASYPDLVQDNNSDEPTIIYGLCAGCQR